VPRAARSVPLAATRREFKKQQKAARKSTRQLRKKSENSKRDGVMIRGRWHSPSELQLRATWQPCLFPVIATQRRQDSSTGPAFDGSFGIDTQDITNIPEVGFGSFQLFPDQNRYFPPDPSLPAFNNTVQEGIDWIQLQAQTAASLGKPMTMTGFGLVTQDNVPSFVPFNSTSAPSVSSTTSGTVSGVTDEQRDDAYMQWLACT